ncbi:MAG TPA: response regulator [Flavisolibacter sp.]|jgi:PleD family two-component response regulator|nr:response regulator [Flavisolibacter sp.]
MNINHRSIYKVLLIDDDAEECIVFEKALTEINPKIIFKCVNDLPEVADAVIDYSPDLIFLDINMRPVNGLEYLKAFKEIQTLDSIPIIIYSGSSNKMEINMAYEHGASLYLIKPDSTKDLIINLDKVLQMNWKMPLEIKQSFYDKGYYHAL